MTSDITTNTDLHGAMPELPKPAIHAFSDLQETFLRAHHYTADQMHEYACAAIEQAAVPEGWQLAPIDPTQAMKLAGTATANDDSAVMCGFIYRAMLAASPAPPKQQPVHLKEADHG